MCCGSVQHNYRSKANFAEKLQELLGDSYTDFDLLSNVEKCLMC